MISSSYKAIHTHIKKILNIYSLYNTHIYTHISLFESAGLGYVSTLCALLSFAPCMYLHGSTLYNIYIYTGSDTCMPLLGVAVLANEHLDLSLIHI